MTLSGCTMNLHIAWVCWGILSVLCVGLSFLVGRMQLRLNDMHSLWLAEVRARQQREDIDQAVMRETIPPWL